MTICLKKTKQRDYKTLFNFIGKYDFNIALAFTILLITACFSLNLVMRFDSGMVLKVASISAVTLFFALSFMSWALYFTMSKYTHKIAMFCGLSEKEYMQFLLDTEEDGFYREFYMNSHEGLK